MQSRKSLNKWMAAALSVAMLFSVSIMPCAAEEEAVAEAAKGTPVIDAAVDEVWNTTEEIATVHWAEGESGSTGRARMLWDDNYLYVLALVNEVSLDDTNPNAWEHDCVEIYLDENNGKTTAYEEDDAFYRFGFSNEQSGMDNVNLEGVQSKTGYIDGGYLVEARIPLRHIKPAAGVTIGFDFHVNDAMGGERTAIHAWSDKTNTAYIMPSSMGSLKLVDTTDRKAAEPVRVTVTQQRPDPSTQVTPKPPAPVSDNVDGAQVTIQFADKRQVMEGFGGNYAKNRMASTAIEESVGKNDKIGEYCLEHLDPQFVRMGIPIIDFEPVNDNGDANSTDFSKFKDEGYVHQNFLLMQDFAKDGREIIGSVWDVPDWMVENPEADGNRVIKKDMYDELAESIAAYVKYALDTYGAKITVLSFNESDGGINIKFTGTQYADIIKRTCAKLEAFGLGDVMWLAGDTSNSKGLIPFLPPQLEDEECRKHIRAVSYHSWDVNETKTNMLEQIYAMAEQYGLPVWVEEVGFDALMFQKPEFNDLLESYEGASRLGINYYKCLKYTGATKMIYWQYQWDFNLLDVYGNIFPSFYFVKQLNETLLPGMTVVGTETDNANISPIAAFTENQVTVNLWSNSTQEGTITVNHLPDGNYETITSSEKTGEWQTGTLTVSGNKAEVVMPAKSMVTLVLKANDGTIAAYAGEAKQPAAPTDTPASGNPETIRVTLNGTPVVMDEPPFLQNDRTMVPLRGVFEQMGAQVNWIDGERRVSIVRGEMELSLTVDDATAYVNGAPIALDTPPVLPNERVYVPVRFICETLGLTVDWNGAARTVVLSYSGDNLLANGGFEGDDGWTLSVGNGVAEYTASDTHSGGRALAVHATGATAYNGVEQWVSVEPGASYMLSWWTKGTEVSSALLVEGGDTAVVDRPMRYNAPSASWTQQSVTVQAGSNDALRVRIIDEGVPGTVYYDDISLTRVG